MTPLKLTSYEQSALAEVCSAMSRMMWLARQKGESIDIKEFEHVGFTFDSIRWDYLYDKLHRTGENS
jgi:hypothetical protein